MERGNEIGGKEGKLLIKKILFEDYISV
jgi:hypothetical protein